MSADRVVVAGGGWAGLAAAVELTAHGVPVTLLESSVHLGGRARRLVLDDVTVDNGQHLFIGAYRETLRLMCRIGIEEQEVFLRRPLSLRMVQGNDRVELRAPRLPAPLHLAYAIARAKGFSVHERLSALRLALRLFLEGFEIPSDTSVTSLLSVRGQSPRLIERLWAPICLATLNVDPERASAQVFLRVLRDAFSKRRSDSDLLFQRVDVGGVFPSPSLGFLQNHGADVRLSTRVTGLSIERNRVCGVTTQAGTVSGSHVVLALPAWSAATMLAPWDATSSLSDTLSTLDYTPITTVYLHYAPHIRLQSPMVGLLGTVGQWVFDRGFTGQNGLMAVVISGTGAHEHMDKSELGAHIAKELARQFGWASPHRVHVVREKRATFLCDVGVEKKRPHPKLAIDGLYLAGDYTATGYPATLEGAVRSGVQCARLILAELGHPRGTPS